MKRAIVLFVLAISIVLMSSCASLPQGELSYYNTEEYKQNYDLGYTDGYAIGYAGKSARVADDAHNSYINGYTQGHKDGLAQRKKDFPVAGTAFSGTTNSSVWTESKYSAERDRIKSLFNTVKNVKGNKDFIEINIAEDTTFDDGRLKISLIDEPGRKAIIIEAPSQPGNQVMYAIEGLKGFEVANRRTNKDDRAAYVPVLYRGSTSFLTGSGTPANAFYDDFAEDLIYYLNDDASFGDKFSNQGFWRAGKNGFRKLGSWLGIGD